MTGKPAAPPRLRLVVAAVAVLAAVAAALGIGVASFPGERLAVDEPQYWFTALSLAEDGVLDISDEMAERRWEQFSDRTPGVETVELAGGRQISPHDPLLPVLLAVPVLVGGWLGAKFAMALLAGALAAATVWTAVRRFAVPPPLAAAGTGIAAASTPLAVYGQQLYPELPAALACLLGVAALSGAPRRRELAWLATAVVTLPWLSVKYTPVAATLAGLAAWRWWRAGRRGEVLLLGAGLAVLGGVYLVVHRVVWGGWTAYASGDHFVHTGEFAVMGVDPDFRLRVWRLIGLLVDRDVGLAVWQPAWLLVVPAVAALLVRPPRGGFATATPGGFATASLALPLLAGWLVASFLALTMHGWWWPGRQTVVVLPLALLAVLCWLARSGTALRAVAAVLGLAGVTTYAALLIDGWAGRIVWVNGYTHVDAPLYQALRRLLPAFRDYPGHLTWAVALVLAALAAAWRAAARDRRLGAANDKICRSRHPNGDHASGRAG
ncbi:MAG: hypothetical protein ABR608_03690 [Pseudonocardiaceae bacterium]